jgi:hypothetical protein
VALYRRGLTEAAIARKLGLTHTTVGRHLTRAGIDPRARRAEAAARRRAAFAAAWNAADDLGAAARAAGLSGRRARSRANWLRQVGYDLKRMRPRPHAGGKGRRIERLLRAGVPVPKIVRRLKVSKTYAYGIKKRLEAEHGRAEAAGH